MSAADDDRLAAAGAEHPIRLDDPALREFPVLYAVEVGYMSLTDAERRGLRDYLLAGGFLVVDDFWGSWEWSNFEREIRAVLPLAAQLQVRIALENVWNNFLLSPLEAARYVDELDSPWVGWYFDGGNVVRYGWPEHWVRTLGPRLLKLDVKEYSRTKRDQEGRWKGFDVKIGDGDCDWPAVMSALAAIKYKGWATAEVPGGDARRLREIADRMDRVLAS